MSRNPYVDLCLRVQALRRAFEERRTPLAPALGVAASVYTHQLANTLRVLTDVRVRHLLADEVGLGKTVQALMILNALKRQRPELRALIIVPDRLVPQWRDELMTRAHTAPYDGEPTTASEGGQYVRLAWEEQLRRKGEDGSPRFALSDIDPKQHQVLIVDELHRLRSDVQDRIVRVAAEFEHILVLTATPSFQRPERHAQLFSVLEPERTAQARARIAQTQDGVDAALSAVDDISSWPAWAAQEVVDALLARDYEAAACEEDEVAVAAVTNCAYRRVIRTRRIDYSGVLPRRQHHPLIVEPLGAEVERQALMWRYFGHLDALSARFDPILLAKRVILSPPSLEQRVDFFRRKGHDRDKLLEEVKPLVHKGQGDSRADALVDLLAGVWAHNPQERVLVAAQDNLTVDYLFDLVQARLPEIGPLRKRKKLVAARIRQGMATEAVEDLGGFGNETSEHLEAFQRGEALVLFAPEAAQVGLNLQCARVLVLYSVPWRPEEVEQWIGRLDRLGNVAAFSSEGVARSIDVYTIAQRGLVDEKVVAILQRFHVFERSVNLDGDRLVELAQLIEDAALRPDAARWQQLEDATEEMAAEDASQELESALRPHLPWDASWATAVRQQLDSMPPAPLALSKPSKSPLAGPRAWDRAWEPMLSLLERAGDYHLRWSADPETGLRFRTLWYQFGEREIYGRKPVMAKIILSFGADPGHERSPKYAHAFITRRGDISNPPLRDVTLQLERENAKRPLRFLSFGDALHDELIDGWSATTTIAALDVSYFEDHALWRHTTPGLFLVRLSILDAAEALCSAETLTSTLKEVATHAHRSAIERLSELMAPFVAAARCALEADARWLRAALTATMHVEVHRKAAGSWQLIADEAAAALLDPTAHSLLGSPRASELSSSAERLAANDLLAKLRAAAHVGRDTWSHRLPDLDEALELRSRVVAEEGRDAVALAARGLERAAAALLESEARGIRAQITRSANVRDGAADTLEMTQAYWRCREAWLRGCGAAVRALRPREELASIIRARRAGD